MCLAAAHVDPCQPTLKSALVVDGGGGGGGGGEGYHAMGEEEGGEGGCSML